MWETAEDKERESFVIAFLLPLPLNGRNAQNKMARGTVWFPASKPVLARIAPKGMPHLKV